VNDKSVERVHQTVNMYKHSSKMSVSEYVSVKCVERVHQTVNMYKHGSKSECE
jgi:hypothetical protein